MAYSQSSAASALGSLLRRAQEERQMGPHLVPASAQEESPFRQQIQGPLAAPESVGSEKVVSLKGEMQPIQEGFGGVTPGIDGVEGPGIVPPVVPPMSPTESFSAEGTDSPVSFGRASSPISSAPSIATSLLPSSAKGSPVMQGNVLGASTSNKMYGPSKPASGSRQTGKLMATPEDLTWAEGKIGKSDKGFEKAQTPLQNVLGGIGKVGTDITSKLSLPQLLPGGAFKKLQDVMAPTVKRLIPNWNKGKA